MLSCGVHKGLDPTGKVGGPNAALSLLLEDSSMDGGGHTEAEQAVGWLLSSRAFFPAAAPVMETVTCLKRQFQKSGSH